jgi:hypothetical protein
MKESPTIVASKGIEDQLQKTKVINYYLGLMVT